MKIKIIKPLKEENSMSGGSAEVYGAPFGDDKTIDAFNKKEKANQRLKGRKLTEAYSSSGSDYEGSKPYVDGDKEHKGHVERSKAQGLKNVVQEKEEVTTLDPTSPKIQSNEVLKSLMDHGYTPVKKIGEGKYGSVYLVKEKSGTEWAAKVVSDVSKPINTVMGFKSTPETLAMEMRNYKEVGEARKSSENIARHFPVVKDQWTETLSDGNYGFIIMEKLSPVDSEVETFVQDAYSLFTREYTDIFDMNNVDNKEERLKDLAQKAELYFQNNWKADHTKALDIVNTFMQKGSNEPFDIYGPEYSKELFKFTPSYVISVIRQFNSDSGQQDYQTRLRTAQSFRDYTLDDPDYKKSQNAANIANMDFPNDKTCFIILMDMAEVIRNIGVKFYKTNDPKMHPYEREILERRIDDVLYQFLKFVMMNYRSYASIDTNYNPQKLANPNLATTKEGPAALSMMSAIKDLEKITGLYPRDIHWNNVMQRDNGDIVIVDLGLFKNAQEIAARKAQNEGKSVNTTKFSLKILTSRRK